MLKNQLVKFMLKRILMFFLILAVAALVFPHRWMLMAGLAAGAALGAGRFLSNAWIFKAATDTSAAVPSAFLKVLLFIANQGVLLLLLFIFYKLNLWLFIGFISGTLLPPIVIIVNSFTEFLGITKNKFYL